MTDASTLQIPSGVAVSSDCLYNLKPCSVRGKSYRASIPSSNKSTFSPQDVAIMYIPGGRKGTFMDPTQSYLRFTVQTNDASANFTVDNMASSFINRIDICHGSNLIETVQGYNVLMSFIKDYQLNVSESYGLSNIYGTSNSGTVNLLRQCIYVGHGQRLTFCIPLLGSLGIGADKMIPIGQLYDDIRIEISWEANSQAAVWSAVPTGTYSVLDCQLELQIIELSDEGIRMVEDVTPFDRPVYLHANSWRHYSSTLPSGTTGIFARLFLPVLQH